MSYFDNYKTDISFPQNNASKMGEEIVSFEHNFLESGLFSDDKLISLIENYPREYYMLTTMTPNGKKPEWFNGDFNKTNGKFILEAIKKGRLWLSLRHFDINAPEYQDLFDEGFRQLDNLNPKLKSSRQVSSILISSPGARVLYHADVPMIVLWHVRGQKKIWLYDVNNKDFLPDHVLEAIVLKETEEEIPYDPEWDKQADAITIQPGKAFIWPHNAPHRVDNLEGVNVSITSEFHTPVSTKRYGVTYANGLMRRKLGWTPKSNNHKGLVALTKCAGAVALKKSGLFSKKERDMMMHFKLDPENCGEVIWLSKDEQTPILQS